MTVKPGVSPLYFLHLHKCGGTTFIKAAAANGHRFALPGNAGMPFSSEAWTAVVQPFWKAGPVWEFWRETDWEAVTAKIDTMLAAGVTCIVQEWGYYDPRLWRRFTRALCIRHPIDRLYSDFLHMEEGGHHVARGTSFVDWVRAGVADQHARLYLRQLGAGSKEAALAVFSDFEVIVILEHYRETLAQMRRHGWASTDSEEHFKSWTPRRTKTGREELAAHADAFAALEERLAVEIQIYERAVALALGRDAPPAAHLPG